MGQGTTNSGMLAGMSLPAGDRELVQIVDASLADAARRAGPWLVCRLGCTQCCFGAFAISQLDALRPRPPACRKCAAKIPPWLLRLSAAR